MLENTLASAGSLRTATEPRRLQILELVWDREMSVNEIAARLPVTVAAVSQHLSKLKAAGLVSVRAERQKRFYQATKSDMGALAVVLESFWTDRLGALQRLAETVEHAVSTSPLPREPDDKGTKS